MQESNDRQAGESPAPASGSGMAGLRFNQVGREEAAVQVLRPQIDSATKTRRVVTVALVLVFFAVMLYVNWVRTGKWNPFETPQNTAPFAPPEPQVPS